MLAGRGPDGGPYSRTEQMADEQSQARRTLILTGASRGIGHATVKRFSSAGWRVITCSRQPFPEDCPWEAGPEDHIQIDLANRGALEAGIAEMRARLDGGALNALVNNAGISPKSAEGQRLGTLDWDADIWQHVFQVNFFASLALAPGKLRDRHRGAHQRRPARLTLVGPSRIH